jgi:hypothetical protein
MAEAGPLGGLLAEIRAWGEAALGDVALVLTRLDGQG